MKTRSFLILGLLAIAVLTLRIPTEAQQKPEELSQKSAESWLALTDSGKFAESWDEASQLFKSAITRQQWTSTVKGVREPLGKVLSRKFKTATYTRTLPGVPDGDYVVVQFETSFEHKASATETVTPMLEKDGKWRVSGYYIR